MLSLVTEDPQHASSIREAPPLSRSRFDCYWYVAADPCPRADLPDRLRNPLVSVRRLACVRAMRTGPR